MLAEGMNPRQKRAPCARCQTWTPRAELVWSLHDTDSPLYCEPCWRLLAEAFVPIQDRSIRLDAYYRRTYKIGMQEYGDFYLRQRGACAICLRMPTKPLVVDHCHRTGVVRGLLCQNCNSGLGMFKDDAAAMGRAIAYLVDIERQIASAPEQRTKPPAV